MRDLAGGGPWDHYERWRRVLEVNLSGVVDGVHAPQAMIDQRTPGAIVNTGSKQGITCPPGDTVYNITKAGVKVFTEGLAYALRRPGLPARGAFAGAGLDLHRHERARPCREAARRLDAGAGRRLHGRAWRRAISTSSAPTTT